MFAKTKRIHDTTMLAAVGLAALGWVSAALAEPTPQNQVTYDTLFRDKIVAVQRSRDTEDDAELIRQMFDTAAAIPDDPGVQQLIYRGIIKLGESGEQYEAVIRAVGQLEAAFPDDPALDRVALLDLFERGYRGARGEARTKVGGYYLDLLMAQAEAAAQAEDTEIAVALYRDAQVVARAITSPRTEEIEKAVDRLAQAALLNTRLVQLERAVRSNPQNQSAARDLVALLMVEKNAPTRAAAFAPQTQDPDLADVVSFAALGLDRVTPPQALRVGDWYFGQAEKREGELAYQLYSLAWSYYGVMLDQYERDDALRQRVATRRQMARDELDKLQAQRLGDQAGQWVNLIEMFDARRHGLGRNVDTRNGKLYSASTDFVLPHAPTGNYNLRLSFQFVEGEQGLVLSLPIGPHRFFDLHYTWDQDRGITLKGVAENNDKALALQPGRAVQLEIEVRPGDDNNSVRVLVDRSEVVKWGGDRGDLTTNRRYLAPEASGRAIRVNCGGQFIFEQIQVLELQE